MMVSTKMNVEGCQLSFIIFLSFSFYIVGSLYSQRIFQSWRNKGKADFYFR